MVRNHSSACWVKISEDNILKFFLISSPIQEGLLHYHGIGVGVGVVGVNKNVNIKVFKDLIFS